ncbi:hypothetical protein MKW98_022129 [Papaver atlanticum]|uniref:Pathogen-related protein n=1 Tax=Papaver atlanticum TaxID=357466 RepID=A0AAD4SYR3_9MAGN|nr:hypothetical protein MKW98_022129 [Papaver atlanticum]
MTDSSSSSSSALTEIKQDKYRYYIYGEGEKDTQWRNGIPNYDVVNKLFEEGRTQVWPAGSIEEEVQNLVKTWEMEMVHKARPQDMKTLDPAKFTFSKNGSQPIPLEEIGKKGSYNLFLQTSLPEKYRVYNPSEETISSANKIFATTFPRGFALEIMQVYSGPPVIVYKFRHWGFMEGPFKGRAPTGEKAEFYAIGIFTLDEHKKIVKVEFFFDGGELLSGLIKGDDTSDNSGTSACPFLKTTE